MFKGNFPGGGITPELPPPAGQIVNVDLTVL